MSYVATLISHPDRAALSDGLLQKVARVLQQAGPAKALEKCAGYPAGLERSPQAKGRLEPPWEPC